MIVQLGCPKKDVDFQWYRKAIGQLWTQLGQLRHCFWTNTDQPVFVKHGCLSKVSDRFSSDATQLNERDFTDLVGTFDNIQELAGFANRRRILNAPQLPRWKQWQIELIKERKWKIENPTAVFLRKKRK